MIKRRLLSYDIPQLTKVFKKDFPQLVTMAEESESAALFKEALRSFVFSDFIASFLIFRIDVVEVDTHSIFLCPVEAIPHPL